MRDTSSEHHDHLDQDLRDGHRPVADDLHHDRLEHDRLGDDRRDQLDRHDDRLREGDPSVVLHEERLLVETRPVTAGRVRVSKRVVTEERTVRVRREELVVEELPVDARDRDDDLAGTGNPAKDAAVAASRPHQARAVGDHPADDPVIEMTLHEEQVVTRVVPVETVRVYVDRITRQHTETAEVAKEYATLEEERVDHEQGLRDGVDRDLRDGGDHDREPDGRGTTERRMR